MKKHEKDVTKFSLLASANQLHRHLWAFLVLFGLSTLPIRAQQPCDPGAHFDVALNGTNLLATASMPNPDAVFTWTWSANNGGGTSNGPTLSIPLDFSQDNSYHIQLNVVDDYSAATCARTIYWTESCPRVGFTETIFDCSATFSPIPPYATAFANHYWLFGDGTTSTETYPTHTYGQTGIYNVCHMAWDIIPIAGDFTINYCCADISIECPGGGGGGGGGGGVIPTDECCRLKICFIHPLQNPGGSYFWDFGDGKTSTEMNPCHYYDNVSTYPINMGGTPTVVVQRCYTPPGGTQSCQNLTVNLVSSLQPAAIYVGEPNVTTNIYVVSSINGLPLFPGNSLVGPYNGPNGSVPMEVHIMGELRFNKHFEFLNHVDFCMDPCAGMVVQHHRNLVFDDHINVRNKCCLWRSIDLEHAANLTSSNENTIRGAQYGIRTKGEMTVMRISDTHFDSNWVGIFLRHPLTISRFDNNTFVSDYTDMHCSAYSCDNEVQLMAQVPHLQRGFSGIVGKNTTLNLPTGTPATNNDFTFMDNGIWLHDSDAEIRRCNFLQIKDLAYGAKSGNGIRFNVFSGTHSLRQWGNGTSFSESTTGIRMYADYYGHILDSRNNHMDVSKYGYRLEIGGTLASGSVIRDNTILTNRHGIDATMKNAENVPTHLTIAMNDVTVNNGTDEGIGILLNDAVPPIVATTIHDIHVQENLVKLNNGRAGIETSNFRNADVAFNVVKIFDTGGGGVTPYPPVGIYTHGGKKNVIRCNTVVGTSGNSGAQHAMVTESSHDNLISGNTLKTTRVGVDFRGICGSTTDFACNTMENHDVAMRYWLGAKTGNQFNKGNRWLGTSFGIAAWHMGTLPSHLDDCRFKAAMGTNQWPPSIDAPNGSPQWFTSGSFVSCNTGCDVMLQPDETNDMDFAIASTGFDMPTNNEVYNWDARRYLYDKLATTPALANQNTTYSAFQANQASASVALLHSSSAQTNGLFAVPTSTRQALDANFAAIQTARSAISAIDASIAAGGLTAPQLTNLLADKETQATYLTSLMASTEQLQAQLLANRASAANSIIAFNNGIVTDAIHDQSEKTLLGIYLNTEAKNLPMTLAQKALVLSIAEQCPESGGYVTYWARAWYAAATGKLVVPQSCMSVGERNEEAGKQEGHSTFVGQFQIAPNPAQDLVTVTFDQRSDREDVSIVLWDAAGLVRLTQTIEHGTTETKLSLQALPNGVYWVSLKTDGRSTPVQKLVILK